MTNLLTRRLALFRIASVAGASAVAAAPVALAAVQPKTPENPELLAVGQGLIAVANSKLKEPTHPVSRQWKGYWQRSAGQ
jgi:hypothetical protein